VSIAKWGIAIGVSVMIISLSVVMGFQEAIRDKIIGFGGHFHVNEIEQGYSKGTPRLKRDDKLLSALRALPEVKHVQLYAASAGIIESRGAIQGVLIKGIDSDFDFTFIKSHLQSGDLITRFDSDTAQILLSSYMASRLAVGVGEKISVYVFQDDNEPRQRNFTICGIYNTGLEQMDQQLVYISLPQMVRMAGWGLRSEIVFDSIAPNKFTLEGRAFGGSGNKKLRWVELNEIGEGPYAVIVDRDTSFTLIASDESSSYSDTSWIQFKRIGNSFDVSTGSSESEAAYIGGYEILIHNFENLWQADDKIFELTTSSFLQTQRITDRIPELFSWLEMLDINVVIIVILMIVISIVNMTSAILIIILERQQFVGILKTMGMPDISLRNVFIRHSSKIIFRGILIGNLIGLGFVFLQYYTSFLPLDSSQYYLDTVPVKISWLYLLLLNLLTALVCVMSMIIPTMYVSRLRPAEALRFH
jgi:lipoprotein-releasing system permease protein